MIVHPDIFHGVAENEDNPRVRIRHARLDRHFGVGKWREVFVSVMEPADTGTIVDADGVYWDWWVNKWNLIEAIRA